MPHPSNRQKVFGLSLLLALGACQSASGDGAGKQPKEKPVTAEDINKNTGLKAFGLAYRQALIDKCLNDFAATNPAQQKQEWAKARNSKMPDLFLVTYQAMYESYGADLEKPEACATQARKFREDPRFGVFLGGGLRLN